jgi:hypothetical protein
MRLTYLFMKTDGSLDPCYTPLSYTSVAPVSATTGDYWYDSGNKTWMKYSGVAWVSSGATLIGSCIQDTTKTVGARTYEYFANYDAENSFRVAANDAATALFVQSNYPTISVGGNLLRFGNSIPIWNNIGPIEGGAVVLTNGVFYFIYVTSKGKQILSTIKPYSRQDDLYGFYHPHANWRCVGYSQASGTNFSFVNQYGMPEHLVTRNSDGAFVTSALLPMNHVYVGVGELAHASANSTSGSTSYADVAAPLVLKTIGRPVMIGFTNGLDNSGVAELSAGASFNVRFLVNSTVVAEMKMDSARYPVGACNVIIPVYGGVNTFEAQAKVVSSSLNFVNLDFFAKEL